MIKPRRRQRGGRYEVHAHDDIDLAVHRADTAMYVAKARGGNQVELG